MVYTTSIMQNYHKDQVANNLTKEILEIIDKENGVLGVFLSGSAARGGNDEFSDIDINILAKDKIEFFKKLPKLLRKTEKVLFYFEPFFLNSFYVYYFKPGYKFDFEVYDEKDTFGEFTLDKTKIVMDRRSILAAKLNKRKKGKIPTSLSDKYIGLALADLYAVAREVKRNDLFDARYNLDDARNCIVTYINLKNGSPYFHPHKFGEFIDKKIYKKMEESIENNSTFKGLIKSSLLLVSVIRSFGLFSEEALKMVEDKIRGSEHGR